jgi:hypothetical protein
METGTKSSMLEQAQNDIAEFKRRIRIMENDKKAYSDESLKMIKR